MFKRKNRLSSWLFKPLLKGKTEFSSSFRVKYLKTKEPLRISVVVPKKIIKKRVERNRIKRQLLHFIKNTIDPTINKDIVFWVTKGFLKKEHDWQKEINNMLIKMDIKKQ